MYLENLKKAPLLLDANIYGKRLSRALRERGLNVLGVKEVFRQGQRVEDLVWLEKAATEGWTALTNDTKAATEHADFLSTSGIRLFVIRFKYKNGKDLTKKIIDLLEKIDKYSKSPSLFVYDMYSSGIRRRKL